MVKKVHPDIPLTAPKMPGIIRAGGIDVVTLSAIAFQSNSPTISSIDQT
jgi:hypothetical protein